MDAAQNEIMDAFLQGHLSKEERRAFEERLAQDPEFRNTFEWHQKMSNAIQEIEFRQTLDKLQSSALQKKEAKIKSWRPLLSIAASIVLLIGLFWVIQLNKKSSFQKQLAQVELDPGLPTLLGTTGEVAFGEGMTAYKLQDFEAAKTYWYPLLLANPSNDTLLFYLAQVDLGTGQNKAAQEKLEQIEAQKESLFREKINWYLAIAALRLAEPTTAIELLKRIVEREEEKREEALELLNYLRE